MATVEMSFTPLPVHVRTARLVATAVARRSGVQEALLDEVRLAVGEACSRAVEAHRAHCPAEPVRIELTGTPGRFEVVVTDAAARGDDGDGASGEGAANGLAARGGDSPEELLTNGDLTDEGLPGAAFPGRDGSRTTRKPCCRRGSAWRSSRASLTTSRSRGPPPGSASG